jgi:hypothetical protein
MGKFLATLAFAGALLLTPSSSAQTVGVPLQVHTGEVYTMRIEQTQTTSIAGHPEARITQVLALEIVDAENRIWRYTPVSMSFSFPKGLEGEPGADFIDWPAASEAVSALTRIATDIGFECRVDEFGRCLEMTNWPLWRDRAENLVLMFDAIARMAPKETIVSGAVDESGAPVVVVEPEDELEGDEVIAPPPGPSWAEMREPILRGLARVLDGIDARDAAATMYLPAATLQGRTLTRRQNVEVADELEMPFGAPPLRMVGTLRLERIDRRANTATIVRRVTLDQASARASLRSMAQFITTNVVEPAAAAAGPKGEGPPSGEALMGMLDGVLESFNFQYQETTTGTVDLATGLARETTTDVTITLSPPGPTEAEPFTMSARTIVRITLGAPEAPRLPRGE